MDRSSHSGRTYRIELGRPHWILWVWVVLMGGVLVTLAVRVDDVDALSMLIPFVVFVVPPIVMLLYRSWAVLDRDAGAIALWRRIVVPWRARTLAFDGQVRVTIRRQRARDGEGAPVGDVWIGDERLATLKPERAEVVADAIRTFFGASG